MIKSKKYTLVLGAGASMPFGFPSGQQLVKEVFGSMHYAGDGIGKTTSRFVNLLLDAGQKLENINKFKYELINSQTYSVDSFLEHRPEFMEIGKAAIGFRLVNSESQSIQRLQLGNWYQYLWNFMNDSFEDFDKNQISVITFNYDRSFEYYFSKALSARFGKSEKESWARFNSLKLIHVHGKLGNLPFESSTDVIDYGAYSETAEQLSTLTKSIKIIHENIDETEEFSKARKAIEEADTIFLIGFGFNQKNLQRLNLLNGHSGKTFSGTRLGLTNIEWHRIFSKSIAFTENTAWFRDEEVLTFFRNSGHFIP
jgi:hypothetical protein